MSLSQRPPLPVAKSSYKVPREPKTSPLKQRLEDLCKTSEVFAREHAELERGHNVQFSSYQLIQKVNFEEHPQHTISQLSALLHEAHAKIGRQNATIQKLQRTHRGTFQLALTKIQHQLALEEQHGSGGTGGGGVGGGGFPSPEPKHLTKLPKIAREREHSPTVSKGRLPARNIFSHASSGVALQDSGSVPHSSRRCKVDLHTVTAKRGRGGGVWPLGAGKGLEENANNHPQGGTPVKLVDMDVLKVTLASLLALQGSEVCSPVEGWRDSPAFLSEVGGMLMEGGEGAGVHREGFEGGGGIAVKGSRSRKGSREGMRPCSGNLQPILEES